ncbi:quinone oxidoreductase-like protein 2 [Vombatus ursinus]|uniref:Enoyl reductase (ER) domain-containing protein n=1 Tax=Vombatus ursinus TaxID=29139 RepID=A0A4X2KKV2_VOMUR|nr:quinone oxidoreductase-like protein 2 [Vombatus ursinus]
MAASGLSRCLSRGPIPTPILSWLLYRKDKPGCSRYYRAAICRKLKVPLAIEEVPTRPIQPDEVRVDVHFCGVNFADILTCQGQYQESPSLPFTPGLELAGQVLEIGTNVSTVKEGDRVISVNNFSTMAEQCIVDQKKLWKIPDGISYQEAAALPVCYGTAILALEQRAWTQPGETVLVTAAAGATGLALIDVASNILQAKVIAAAGSDEKCKLALQRGAKAAVNYSQGNLKEELKKLTGGQGINVVIDAVGGDVCLAALCSLAWEGRMVVIGFAGGAILSIPSNLLLLKNVSAMGVYWTRYQKENFSVFSRCMTSALRYCQEGSIRPYIGGVFKLEEINDAFEHVTQRKTTGKVILSVK